MEGKQPNGLKRIARISYGRLYQREINISLKHNYIIYEL